MIIICPRCKQKLKITGERVPEKIVCPSCKTVLRIKTTGQEREEKKTEPPRTAQPARFSIPTLDSSPSKDVRNTYSRLKTLNGLINGYRIDALIAVGSNSLMFKGTALNLKQTVAIKVLFLRFSSAEQYPQQFLKETAILNQVRHPNLVSVLDRKEIKGLCVLITEYVEGENLKHIKEKRPLSVNEIINITVQVQEGLSYLHDMGVVHRNLTPSNIMVDNEGKVRITDFGIMQMLRGQVQGIDPAVGTLNVPARFIAPEVRAHPEKLDCRSDIYSLGAVFFELFTRAEFDPSSPVHASKLNSSILEPVDNVLARALHPDLEQRYFHVAEFCQDVIYALTGKIKHLKPDKKFKLPISPRVFVPALSLLVILILVFGGLRMVGKTDATRDSIKASAKAPHEIQHALQTEPLQKSQSARDVVSIPSTAPSQHLLITEVNVFTPEFIELYNPTDQSVELEGYYITDAVYDNGDYFMFPQGKKIKGGEYYDFTARFPDGAVIQPGEFQIISIGGSRNFVETFGIAPTYELTEDDPEGNDVPELIDAFPGTINPDPTLTTLSNTGESIMLFYWDGISDLVKDVDYIVWGDKEEAVCKTNLVCDGPDSDDTPTDYFPDTPITEQRIAAPGAPSGSFSFQRVDLDEIGEAREGGNGITGHDETSEWLDQSFTQDVPTPGYMK